MEPVRFSLLYDWYVYGYRLFTFYLLSVLSILKRIIWPVGFTVVAYMILVFCFGRFMPQKLVSLSNFSFSRPGYGHLLLRSKEASTIEETDVLILGSSHAYRGFDPRMFRENEIKIFNFGSSSQTAIQSEYLCKKYLDQMNPKWVIIETYAPLYSNDGVEANLDFISNTPIDLSQVSMVAKTPDPRIVNTFLYKWIMDITNQKREYQSIHRGYDKYIKGGYVQKKTDQRPQNLIYDESSVFIIPSQREALRNLIDYCSLNDVKVLLVQAPVSNSYYNSLMGMDSFDLEMNKLAPYINYNQKLPLIDSLHFYDHHHLNQAGVEIFNHAVIKDLRELMALKEVSGENSL